jgi:hypothetical protein
VKLVRPRGTSLAEQSGGFAILDGGDLPAALQRIISTIRQ